MDNPWENAGFPLCPIRGILSRNISIPSMSETLRVWIVQQHTLYHVPVSCITEKFGVSKQLFYAWDNLLKNGKPLNSRVGRPTYLGKDILKVAKKMLAYREGGTQTTAASFRNLLVHAAKEERKERNVPEGPEEIFFCTKTYKKYARAVGVSIGTARSFTKARQAGCSSLLNMVSFMTAQLAMSRLTREALTLNSDATTFKVGSEGDKTVTVVYCGKGGDLKAEYDEGSCSGITAYFVKYYLLISAAGFNASPVFVLQDPQMDEEDCNVTEVKGFGVSTSVGEAAYVVYCKSRACNKKFYTWYNETILMPFVHLLRSTFHIDKDVPAWYQLDGEQRQIDVFSEPAMLAKLSDANISVGKPPGSTSSITQPCDIKALFQGPKCVLRVMSKNSSCEHASQSFTPVQTLQLQKSLKAHEDYMKVIRNRLGGRQR